MSYINSFLTRHKYQTQEVQNKHVAPQNLSIYYTWKNVRKQCKNNKPKIIVPTWNDDFELPDGSYSVSDIQDYIKYINKKHETFTTISPIYVYINRINKRLVFKIDIRQNYKRLKSMKIFGTTTKNKNKQIKKYQFLKQLKQFWFNVILDNQYQQQSEVLYTFTPN